MSITYTLSNDAECLPTYLKVTVDDCAGDWRILNVSMYAHNGYLIYDDIDMGNLPPSTQMAIYGALGEADHERRVEMMKLRKLVS